MEIVPFAIDLETTASGYNGSPKPCYPKNEILAAGIQCSLKGHSFSHSWIKKNGRAKLLETLLFIERLNQSNNVVLVGHNIKFDLGYLIRDFPEIDWTKFTIWDTAEVAYLHSGHTLKFPALEDVAKRYGVTYIKRLDLGAWLAAGNKMEDIDEIDLVMYVTEDAHAADRIFYEQYRQLNAKQRKHAFEVCGKLLALAAIELNGMYVDHAMLGLGILDIEKELRDIDKDLRAHYIDNCGLTSKQVNKLNMTANRTVSSYLTGVPHYIPVGKRKADKEDLDISNGGTGHCVSACHGWTGETPNPNTGYSVSESKLREIQSEYTFPSSINHKYIDMILRYRELNKILNTYYTTLLDINKFTGGYIYTNINTTKTFTGRTSSDSPNFQNMPAEVRKVFRSRHEGWEMVEIDFKQLELCAIAELSKDIQMIYDISHGVDIHYEIGKTIFEWTDPKDMNEVDRRTVKTVVFGLCYGGGAKTLGVQAGISQSLAKDIIDAFYERYPGVRDWHTWLINEVESTRCPTGIAGKRGEVLNESTYTVSKTGRTYLFTEVEAPEWLQRTRGITYSFSPTVIKNYPAQGFAGGDIVMTFLTVLYDMLKERKLLTLLVNTIHDSIVAEVPLEEMEEFKEVVKIAQDYTTKYWELSVPLVVEVKSAGLYWK